MGEWVLIPDINSYTGHIRTKGRLPQIPGYSPWREKTSQNSSWPHTENHHASRADGSDSHPPNPSTQCTIPPGTTTIVPIPDEHSSCGYPRQLQPVPDTGSKNPADYENVCRVIPCPSAVSALSEIKPLATVGGSRSDVPRVQVT